jgi:hypothetical protein
LKTGYASPRASAHSPCVVSDSDAPFSFRFLKRTPSLLETSVRNTSMCGIFGHYTFQVPHPRREILDTLFAGLHRLEYRGYDSAGMAIDSDDPVKAEVEASPLGRKGLAGIDVNIDAATDLGPLCERAAKFGTQQQLLGKHRRDFVPRPVLFKASGKVDELVASTREQAEHAGLDLDAGRRTVPRRPRMRTRTLPDHCASSWWYTTASSPTTELFASS